MQFDLVLKQIQYDLAYMKFLLLITEPEVTFTIELLK